MGNVPPLDVVAHWAVECLNRAAPEGGMILSVGGGVSPDTPAENLDAMIASARAWRKRLSG
jgi:uroporphyrinogen decarboxylase